MRKYARPATPARMIRSTATPSGPDHISRSLSPGASDAGRPCNSGIYSGSCAARLRRARAGRPRRPHWQAWHCLFGGPLIASVRQLQLDGLGHGLERLQAIDPPTADLEHGLGGDATPPLLGVRGLHRGECVASRQALAERGLVQTQVSGESLEEVD